VIPGPDPETRRALRRRIMRAVLAHEGLKRLPPRQRRLLTGSQGSGKTRVALESVAALRGHVIVWMTQPTTAKAIEVAADYASIAGPESLPVKVVRGRSTTDLHHPDTRMCLRHEVVEEVAKRGVSIPRAICGTCPLRNKCGYMRQDREIKALGSRAFFVLAREYIFLPCPAPKPDLLIADEAVTLTVIEEISFPASNIEKVELYRGGVIGTLGKAITAGKTLSALHTALRAPRPLKTLRNAGLTVKDLRLARHVVAAAVADVSNAVSGAMEDDEIMDVLDALKDDPAPNVRDLLDAVLIEVGLARDTLTGVVYHPEKGEKVAHVAIHRLRLRRSIPRSASILVLDGTGSLALNRALFPGIRHVHIPVERMAHVTGTIGKSYSRQSLTGMDRRAKAIPEKEAAATRLRQEITTIVAGSPGPVLVVTNKNVATGMKSEIHTEDARHAHFGAVRGLNEWEDCRSAVVVGRESVSIETVEDLARAYLASDAAPFVSMAATPPPDWPWRQWSYRATRGRRMADGTVQAVEVELHPDPRAQELLEQIREAEIVQAADRVRPVFNERTIVLMNNLALDMTYNRVLRHADLVAGGSRWERAWAATGIIPLGAVDLRKAHPTLFPSVEAARLALKREPPNWGQSPNSSAIWVMTPINFRLKGRPGPAGRILVDTVRHAAPRAAVEAVLGPMAWFGSPDDGDATANPTPNATPRGQAAAETNESIPPADVRNIDDVEVITGMVEAPVTVEPAPPRVQLRHEKG
jgi:hypothetical protein